MALPAFVQVISKAPGVRSGPQPPAGLLPQRVLTCFKWFPWSPGVLLNKAIPPPRRSSPNSPRNSLQWLAEKGRRERGRRGKGREGSPGSELKSLHRDTQSRSRVEHRSPRMSHQRGPGAWRQWWIAEWEVKIRQQSRGVCRYPGDLGHRDRQRSTQEPSNQLPAYCHSAPPPSSHRALSERRSWEDHLRARKASATAKASRRERKEAGAL